MAAALRLHWEIARRGYSRHASYRAATIAGLFTNVVFGFMRGYILMALFASRDEIGGYDVTDTLTYTWLTQGMIATVVMYGWFEVALRIRTGEIASDLHRPLDLQLYWLAQDLGRAAYHAVFRGVPPFLVGMLAFELTAPADVVTVAAFAVSVLLAVCVSFAFRFLINLSAFWLLDYRGAVVLGLVAANLFSGFIVPLAFFPDWLETVAYALPFASMIQIPVDVFLGKHEGVDLVAALGQQAIWAGGLLLVGRAALAAGTRRLVIQGG